MLMTTWALDDGYGDLKGHNGGATLLVPSYYTNWRPPQKADFNDGKALDQYSHITAEIDGAKYLIGKGAIQQDTKLAWTGGENKHLDLGFPLLLKTSLALMSEQSNEVQLEPLVMGLPVKADDNEERQKLLQNIVLGEHNIKLTLADGITMEKNIVVKELLVKKQPFGSFCDVIMDMNGNMKDKKLASQFNVVIDIGARTLNIYTLDALDPIYDLSDTTNDGVYTAYEWVRHFIEGELKLPVTTGRMPYIIEKKEIKGLDLTQVIRKSYETLVNEISKVINTMFVNSWAFVDNIIITGGGSEVLKPWLQTAFQDKSVIFLGRYSTVRGLLKYGVRHARKQGMAIQSFPTTEKRLGEGN